MTPLPNTRVQRTRALASLGALTSFARSPLTRYPLGSCASEWCQESWVQVRGLPGWCSNLNGTGVVPRVGRPREPGEQPSRPAARFELWAA